MLLIALGLVTMVTGREPRTGSTIEGVAISKHEERATEGELTRTVEIEDVVENSTDLVLEGRWQAHVPRGAAVTRVALEIASVLVDGEVLESEWARSIYRGIVDRPVARDPALVEKRPDGTISVKVFPIPAHGSRRVLLRYTQALPSRRDEPGSPVTIAVGSEGFFLHARVRDADAGTSPVAIIIDVSHDRSPLARATELAEASRLLSAMPEGRPFAVLACDSACEAFPETGLMPRTTESGSAVTSWLSQVRGGGARDVASAVRAGAMHATPRGRVTFVGSGRATSGVLGPLAVARETRRALGDIPLDVVPVEDEAGALDALAVAVAAPLVLPSSLRPEVSRLEGAELMIWGRVLSPTAASDLHVTVLGAPRSARMTKGEGKAADALLAQARIEALESRKDSASLDRAGEVARKAHVLSQRGSFLVLESEEMFARFGIARTRGAAKARPEAPEPPLPKGMHRVRAPSIRASSFVIVNGRLGPENIQHVLRQNFARYRFCYEQGLRANPALSGRAVMKFAIDRTGLVSAAQDGGSDLPDAEVVSCMVKVTKELTFAEPDGGIVTVVYPFMLTPEEGTSEAQPWLQLRTPRLLRSPHDIWTLRTRAAEHPNDAAALDELGDALVTTGAYQDAGLAFDALTDLRPDDTAAHLRAATSYARALDLDRALSHLVSAWSPP